MLKKIISGTFIATMLICLVCLPLAAIFIICKLCAVSAMSWICCCVPIIIAIAVSPALIIAKLLLDAKEV